MCDFISWIEYGKKIYFLTGKQIYDTPRGEAFQAYTKSKDDYTGHGAIRWFYELDGEGTQKECTNFSTPKNFPTVIVQAIKRGDMRGLGTPEGLLKAPAWKAFHATALAWRAFLEAMALADKAYDKATASARKAYDEAKASAEKVYLEAMAPADKAYLEAKASARKAYDKAKASAERAYLESTASAERAYQEATAPAWKAYQEATALAWKAYQEAKDTVFWDLFAKPENRAEAWR